MSEDNEAYLTPGDEWPRGWDSAPGIVVDRLYARVTRSRHGEA